MPHLHLASDNPAPKPFHPFCKACGWRKGGVDSWNGTACKCGHSESPIQLVVCTRTDIDMTEQSQR